jgi:hypothetical protein
VSGDIVQSGAIQASSAALLSSGAGIQVFGQGLAQTAGSAVVLSAQKGIDLNVGARISSTATGGRVTLGAQQAIALSSGSSVAAAGDVALSSDTQLNLSGAQLQSNASVNLLAGGGITMSSSTVNALSIQLETGKALPMMLQATTYTPPVTPLGQDLEALQIIANWLNVAPS